MLQTSIRRSLNEDGFIWPLQSNSWYAFVSDTWFGMVAIYIQRPGTRSALSRSQP